MTELLEKSNLLNWDCDWLPRFVSVHAECKGLLRAGTHAGAEEESRTTRICEATGAPKESAAYPKGIFTSPLCLGTVCEPWCKNDFSYQDKNQTTAPDFSPTSCAAPSSSSLDVKQQDKRLNFNSHQEVLDLKDQLEAVKCQVGFSFQSRILML